MVVVVDRDPKRPGAMPVPFAVFEKVGDQFFFARTAELHLVDVHPEIVFVAPIGGIDDAAFAEAHRLYVVEAGAPRRAAPDGMAPIVDPSTRDRCQRHNFLHSITCQPTGIPEALAYAVVPLPSLPAVVATGRRAAAGDLRIS